MGVRRILWGLLATSFLAGAWLATGHRALPQASQATPAGDYVGETSRLAELKGTASCSARACHGGLEPVTGGPIRQDEFKTWLTTDKHAQAYNVLKNERSASIARNLDPTGKVKAYEDARCLACHTNPLVADAAAGLPLLLSGSGKGVSKADALVHDLVVQERLTGVGCEACHGTADKWFAAHTATTWRKEPAAKKWDLGMVPTGETLDLAAFARRCAGCHVGAPPDGDRLPVRDVNHDLIAAGHPRLHFEFSTFLANLAPHWDPQAIRQGTPDFEARAWEAGQLASAHAALRLLEYRATPGKGENAGPPWPEFAEYDCFACHHDLGQPSPRQKKEHYGQRTPGSFPWGNWYFSMPELLAGQAPDGGPVARALDELTALMAKPFPDRKQAADQARAAAGKLGDWQKQVAAGGVDVAGLRKRLAANAAQKRSLESWDVAEQVYLAAAALTEGDKALQADVNALGGKLAFPPGKDASVYDSAKGFGTDPAVRERLAALLKRLGQ